MIGKTVSHYKIIEQLGSGGMGVVYKAEDTKLKRTVALKFLPPALSSDKEAKTRFVNEARAASALDHPNICTIHEIGETEDGQSYIAMACYDGISLKDRIAGLDVGAHRDAPIGDTPLYPPLPGGKQIGDLTIAESINITIQIAKGLVSAHEKGIVHRDIKPANIIITDQEEVKILDFGLAKLAGQTRLTKTGSTVGTIAYMSPEQAKGEMVDHRTDIWSLGVVIYEMLTGQLPFKGDYEQAMVYSIINEQPLSVKVLNEDVSEELEQIINKCLVKDVESRYQTIDDLLADFKSFSKELDISFDESLPKLLQRVWRKKIVRRITAAATTIVLFVAAGMLFWPKVTAPIPIAVISFENMTGNPEYDYLANVIPNLLITGLGQSDRVRVLTWDYLRDLLKQLDIRDVKTINREMGYRICKKAGISTLVTGSYARIGNSYVTDVKVIDPATKEIIVPVSARGEDLTSILYQQIDELSRAILEGIHAIDSTYLAEKRPVQEITTTSFKAYQYYVRAGEIGINNQKECIRFLERAVEMDSTFSAAYMDLWEAYFINGKKEKAKNAIIKAYRHIDRAPQDGTRERIYATYAFDIEKDFEKFARFVDAGLKKNPYNKQLWLDYEYYYTIKNNPYERLNCIKKALEIDPEYKDALIEACYAYAWMGDKNNAIEFIEKYMKVDPGSPNTMDTAGEVYYILGMFKESLEQFRELTQMYPNWSSSFRFIYIHILQQNYDQARQELDKYLEEATPEPNWKASVRLYRALFFYYMGEISQAFAEIDSILSRNDLRPSRISQANELKGYLLLDQHNITAARQAFLLFRADKDQPDKYDVHRAMICLVQGNHDSCRYYTEQALLKIVEFRGSDKFRDIYLELMDVQMYCDLLQAEILLASDSIDQAIDYYNQIRFPRTYIAYLYTGILSKNVLYNIPIQKDIVPRALVKKGDIDGAIEAYEKWVEFLPGQKEHFFINPVYHYRLAKLYQQDGQRQKAIDRYRIFLDIWKNADTDQPELIDAKKQLARLEIQK
jgi:serine/threonine protein kinase/tetratricopeptide (TPR) repeat protein